PCQTAYDGHLFLTENNSTGDFLQGILRGLPANQAVEPLSLNLDTGVDYFRYVENPDQSFWQGHFTVNGRYDVNPGLAVLGVVEVLRLVVPRDEPNSIVSNSNQPTVFYDLHGSLGFLQDAGRFYFGAVGTYQRVQYPNNEGFNTNSYSIDARAGYNYVGNQSVFVRLRGNITDYEQAVDASGLRRGSKGYQATVGAQFDLG